MNEIKACLTVREIIDHLISMNIDEGGILDQKDILRRFVELLKELEEIPDAKRILSTGL